LERFFILLRMEADHMKNIVENLKNPLVWVYLLSFIKVTLGAVGVDIAPEQWAQYEDVLGRVW
jgi:hypothetical protein